MPMAKNSVEIGRMMPIGVFQVIGGYTGNPLAKVTVRLRSKYKAAAVITPTRCLREKATALRQM